MKLSEMSRHGKENPTENEIGSKLYCFGMFFLHCTMKWRKSFSNLTP